MTKRVLILVEGQTEERFVKDVLAPEFYASNVYLFPTIRITKHVKSGPNFKGGVTNYEKFRNDVERLLGGSGGAVVTTLLDYYGLPSDFPGMSDRPNNDAFQRVVHVENAIHRDLGSPDNFLPFLALHEFEAWLFSAPDELPKAVNGTSNASAFHTIRNGFSTPEQINEGISTAPSKRIKKLFPAYAKTVHGPMVAKRIGLTKIRGECPHFDSWIQRLHQIAAS